MSQVQGQRRTDQSLFQEFLTSYNKTPKVVKVCDVFLVYILLTGNSFLNEDIVLVDRHNNR